MVHRTLLQERAVECGSAQSPEQGHETTQNLASNPHIYIHTWNGSSPHCRLTSLIEVKHRDDTCAGLGTEGAEALAVVPVAPVLELVHHEVDVHPGLVSTVPNPCVKVKHLPYQKQHAPTRKLLQQGREVSRISVQQIGQCAHLSQVEKCTKSPQFSVSSVGNFQVSLPLRFGENPHYPLSGTT